MEHTVPSWFILHVKVHLALSRLMACSGRKTQFHSFLISALNAGDGQPYAYVYLPHERAPAPVKHKAERAVDRVRTLRRKEHP